MRFSVKRLARYLRRSTASVENTVNRWRPERGGPRFEYFAVHDGRTLNACVDVDAGPDQLILDGAVSVTLPAPALEGRRRVWVTDLLALNLPLGTYSVNGADGATAKYAMLTASRANTRRDVVVRDAKVVDIDLTAAVTTAKAEFAGIEFIGGDDGPRLTSLNYFGPDAFKLNVSRGGGQSHIVATARETGDVVEIGELADGVGVLRAMNLYIQDSGAEMRWDVTLRDAAGLLHPLGGPAIDFDRPDRATTFGDVSFVRSGRVERWKPYITRDGFLAVRVTSTKNAGAS